MMLTEAIQWMALAWSMIDKNFAREIDRQVGPNAFTGAAATLYRVIFELRDMNQARDLLGFPHDGRLSDLMLKHLTAEAEALWGFKNDRQNWGTAKALRRIIDEAAGMMLAMCRHDGEKKRVFEEDETFADGEGI